MLDKNAKRGFLSVALNEGRTFFDLALFFLSHRGPLIRVPILAKSEEEQLRSSLSEIGLASIQRKIDMERFLQGEEPWLRTLADFLLSTGWFATMDMVVRSEDDGTPQFISDVYDPALVYPEYGNRRMERLAYIYPATLGVVQSKAEALNWTGDYTGEGGQIVWVNVVWEWRGNRLHNSILIEGRKKSGGTDSVTIAKDGLEPENLKDIPIHTGPAAGWAVRSSRPGRANQQMHLGEGVLEAGRPIYDMQNIWTTLIMQKAWDSAQPTMAARSRSGRFTVSEADMVAGVIIPMKLDEELAAIQKPDIPPSIPNVIMPILGRGSQRAGIADLFFGNVENMDLAGAGFAISLLEPNALSKLAPYAKPIEMLGKTRDAMYLEAFRSGDFSPIRIGGRSEDRSASRQAYYQDWSPGDIPEHSYVDWEVQLATPSQLIQAIAIARQAMPQGDLLDIDIVLEQLLKVDDVARAKEGIREAQMGRDPRVVAIRVAREIRDYANELREAGDTEFAEAADQLWKDTLASVTGSTQGQTDNQGLPPQVAAAQARQNNNGGRPPAGRP